MSHALNKLLESRLSPEAAKKLPNQLTVLRFLLVPVFVALLCFPSPLTRWLATLVFIVAAITDYLDGSIARYFKVESDFGKLMDPLADKVLTMAALVMMLAFGPEYAALAWLVVLILAREILITGLRSLAALKGVVLKASPWGKYKTIAQMVALILLLPGELPVTSWDFFTLGKILLWISAGLALYSGADYALKLRSCFGDQE